MVVGVYFQWSAVIPVKGDGEWTGGLGRQLGQDVYEAVCRCLHTEAGDLLVITAGKHTDAVSFFILKLEIWQKVIIKEER